MARKLRVELPGALYHVINRGNYRRDVFETVGAAQAFVTALEETTASFGWRIHAYVVMQNHYHVVLETPQPNLVAGMHWLQTTLATRFNRFRTERGHLFQGRYHAGLIEDFRVLEHVVDYVHLNPARAGLVPPEQSGQFRWSSLGRFIRSTPFADMVSDDWLTSRFGPSGTDAWTRYLAHLTDLAINLAAQKQLGWEGFSHGWALGSEDWRRAIAKDQSASALTPGLSATEARALREATWSHRLEEALVELKRTPHQLATDRKGAPWKIELAHKLQRESGAAVTWLAQNLHLGAASGVRSLLYQLRLAKNNNKRPDPIQG